jgi:hypothetical protein
MRNPSKNTIKRIFRANLHKGHDPGWGLCNINRTGEDGYHLFNEVGARLYIMSKGRICNREPKGHLRYVHRQVEQAKRHKANKIHSQHLSHISK